MVKAQKFDKFVSYSLNDRKMEDRKIICEILPEICDKKIVWN